MSKTSFFKSQFWSSKNDLGPDKFALNSHKKCWFDL